LKIHPRVLATFAYKNFSLTVAYSDHMPEGVEYPVPKAYWINSGDISKRIAPLINKGATFFAKIKVATDSFRTIRISFST
jgi:hypothetical protein